MSIEGKTLTLAAAKAKAFTAIWTFPSILASAIVIAWGAESAQFLVSQALALTLLALIQTLPEFAVEGVIAWRAGQFPTSENIGLMTANFTGALRLLIGLGWPLIYFTTVIFNIKRAPLKKLANIKLEQEHSVEILGLLLPSLYMLVIVLKGSLSLYDLLVLLPLYTVYVLILLRLPPRSQEKVEEVEPVPRFILRQKRWTRNSLVWACFLVGGIGIMSVAEPFLESMLGLATVLGVSSFVFVQWVAPFLSEFPEKISAFYWARTVVKAPIALMNMVSSGIAELTLLICLIPIVYCFSRGGIYTIEFDFHHRVEILLTAVQSLLGFVLLANMEFRWYEAVGLFGLWFAQFIYPSIREEILIVYGAWIVLEVGLSIVGRRRLRAFGEFGKLIRAHILCNL
jgi:cation:H+ antiporter